MSAETQRKAYRYNCNMIRPQLYSEKSLMESVVDFFSDVVPQAYSQQKVEDKEKIQWVRFENCDCSDIARNPDLFKYDTKGLPLLLILGYSNGVQIWHITPNGEALEILSIRQGPVKICRILPNPEPVLGYTDSFSSKRPLIVMCDSSSAGQPFCGMKFVSLKTGDEVHSVSFKTLPVHNIECNKRFLVATFLEKVCVYEACRFKQLFWITSCYPCPGPNVNPIALSSRWLAYADRRLVPMHQSCGGMSGDGTQSYAATVISAAKGAFKGLSMFGEAMVNSMTGCKPSSSKKQQDYVQLDNGNRPGIVSVVDIQNIHNDHFNVNEDNEGSGLIAHFHAHANEPVADMAFDPTGTLLVTACKLGHNFHIFRLMAHPCSSSLGAVHHLYTLHRGDTTAKVIDIGFNHDSRWVTVSTHRGTTHVFAITPYGGIPNVRTHCQPFVVNRASRFHRSAGLEDIEHSPLGRRSPVLSTSPSSSGHYDRYPTLIQQNTLNNNMGNPRLPPYPHPITLYPLFQIKQPLNVVLNPANKNMSPNHSPTGVDNIFSVASRFCTPRLCVVGSPKLDVERREAGKRPVDCLFIMAQSGTLVEYVLEPKARSVSEKVHDESMLELNVVGRMQWNLQRLKTSSELRPPLPTNSPLILSHEAVVSQVQTSPEYYDLPGLTRHDSKDSLSSDHSGKDEDEWVSQVEIITHAGPHRRLWMGPQFSFKTYQENTTVLSSHSSALLSQSTETNMVAMDFTGEEGDLESLRVQPTRSNPVSMPNARPAYRRLSSDSSQSPGLSGHSAPLLIEAGSFDQSPHLLDVYSNWTESTVEKQPRGSDDIEEDKIKETLADAMVESPMRDMEKLSFRQELTRAAGRKGMTDCDRKKNEENKRKEEKERKEAAGSGKSGRVETRDKKSQKPQTKKQEVEVQKPVKSESIQSKPMEKGRTETFDKTLSDKQLACVPECSSNRPVDKIDKNSTSSKQDSASPSKEKTNTKAVKEKVIIENVNQTSLLSKQNNDEKVSDKIKNGKKKKKSKSANKDMETAKSELLVSDNCASMKSKSEEILTNEALDINVNEIISDEFCKSPNKEENIDAYDKGINPDSTNKHQLDSLTIDVGKDALKLDENQHGFKADVQQSESDQSKKFDEPAKSVETLDKEQGDEAATSTDMKNEVTTNKDVKCLNTDHTKSFRDTVTLDKQEDKNRTNKTQKKKLIKAHDSEIAKIKDTEEESASMVETKDPDTSCKNDAVRETKTPDKSENKSKSTKKQKKGKEKKKDGAIAEEEQLPNQSSNEGKSTPQIETNKEHDMDLQRPVINLKDYYDELNDTQQVYDTLTNIKFKQNITSKDGKLENLVEETSSKPSKKRADDENMWVMKGKKKRQKKLQLETKNDIESIDDKMQSLDIQEPNHQDKEIIKRHCSENKEMETLGSEAEQDLDYVNQTFESNKKDDNVPLDALNDIETLDLTDVCGDIHIDKTMCHTTTHKAKEERDEIEKRDVTENTKSKGNVDISDEKSGVEQVNLPNIESRSPEKQADIVIEPIIIEKKKQKKNKKESQQRRKGKSSDKKEGLDDIQVTSVVKDQDNEQSDIEILQDEKPPIEQTDSINIPQVISQTGSQSNESAKSLTEPLSIQKKDLNLGNLEIPLERTDSLERSPSFESVRSTFSEERGHVKNDGTDSELLASTEQSDNDMTEVKSKKKKKKKKNNMDESLYYEASEPEIPQENKQGDQDTNIISGQCEKTTENKSEVLDTVKKTDELSQKSDEINFEKITSFKEKEINQEQDMGDKEMEMFVVKSKRGRKNKKSQEVKNFDEDVAEASEPLEKNKETTNVLGQGVLHETESYSTDITPVNSEDSVKVSSLKIDLKIPCEDAISWEAAAKSKSNESQKCDEDLSENKDEKLNDTKRSAEVAVNEKENSKNSTETSNSSGRSSEERDLDNLSPAKPSGSETKSKKKRKKNKK